MWALRFVNYGRLTGWEAPMETERAVIVYTTYPSVVEAEEAGRMLVEQRLCACVNIIPGMVSYYWWNGALERGEEAIMLIKTRVSLSAQVAVAVKEKHSYATPAIMVLPIENVEAAYFDWLMSETAPAAGSTG
jgi:periplasmic divalent cation tolerance protein